MIAMEMARLMKMKRIKDQEGLLPNIKRNLNPSDHHLKELQQEELVQEKKT